MKRVLIALLNLMNKYSIFLVLLILFIICWNLNENFISIGNLKNIPTQISATTILALGETILIISGMLDLSCGSVLALSGVISVSIYMNTGLLSLAVAAAVAVGVFCNFLNGLMVTRFKIPSFIATLAMMEMARGAALMFTKGIDIPDIGGYTILGQGQTFGIPNPVFFLAAFWVVTWYLLKHTVLGRSIYAIGGNQEAALASGINVSRMKMKAFLINGVFVGVAGVIFMSRNNIGSPSGGVGYEFTALTAAIIGGTSFSGGIGSAFGTIAGALIVAFLGNIMVLTNVDSYLQRVIGGAVIALAVIYDINAKTWRIKRKPSTGDSSEDLKLKQSI
jgi:inositol transport system permease protein